MDKIRPTRLTAQTAVRKLSGNINIKKPLGYICEDGTINFD